MHHYRPKHSDPRAYGDLALKSLSRLGSLPDDDVKSLFQSLNEIETWPQGRDLVAEGAADDHPRILLDGWALCQRGLADGRRQIFGFILPGDVFGLCARPDHITMYAIVAATPCVSSPLPFLGKAMREGKDPLSTFAWRMIAREEANLLDQVVRLGRMSARERLVHLLLEFHVRLAEMGEADGPSFHLPLSQEVLSDALGLSVVHTNRILQQLRRERLIETHGSHLILSDFGRMAELTGYRARRFEPSQADAQASLNVPSCSSTETVTSNPSA